MSPLVSDEKLQTRAVPCDRPLPSREPSVSALWRRGLHKLWRPVLSLPLDAAAVVLGFWLAHLLRFRLGPLARLVPPPGALLQPWSAYAREIPGIIAVWLFFFHHSAGLYRDVELSLEDEVLKIAKGCAFGLLGTLAFGFLFHRFEYSRLLVLMAAPLILGLVFAGRRLSGPARRLLVRTLRSESRVLVLGQGKMAELLARKLERSGRSDIRILPIGAVEAIVAEVDRGRYVEVLLAQMSLPTGELLRLSDECDKRSVELKIVPGLLEVRMGEVQLEKSLGLPMLRIHHVSFSGANSALKRACDLAFCAVFFTVFALPLALLCLLIKLDSPGPILFTQRRCGYKGQPFNLFKFRTMVDGAEAMLDELRSRNERPGKVFKIKDDPRVTRIGRFLRKYSLDEVPQFLNVLRGEMSVVGPRPPLPDEVADYEPGELKRLNVYPGITGLWQVSGRADLDFHQMVALDLFYLEHWSPGLDLKIILKTPSAILNSKGAY